MPVLGDQSGGQIRKSMQPILLQPFRCPRPPTGLDREEKLAFAAYDLEQQQHDLEDKIREYGRCEKALADCEPVSNPLVHPSRQEPGLKALHAGMRSTWKRHGPKPVVKSSRRPPPNFNLQPRHDHVSVAKRAIDRRDHFEQHLRSTTNAFYQARDGHVPGETDSHTTPVMSSSTGYRTGGPTGSYDASRDPRLKR